MLDRVRPVETRQTETYGNWGKTLREEGLPVPGGRGFL